jgi:hypothetical protein
MLWRIFQALIMFAVLSANHYYGWTPNGVVSGVWAILAAFVVTVAIVRAKHLVQNMTGLGRQSGRVLPDEALAHQEVRYVEVPHSEREGYGQRPSSERLFRPERF